MKFRLPKLDSETAVLFFVTFFIGSSVSMLAPLIPEIRNEYSLSYTAAALVFSSYGIARLLISLPSGYLYHRINRRILLAAGLILMAVSSVVAFYSTSFVQFIASQVIMGAGFSFCVTTIVISLSLSATRRNRGKTLGMNTFARSASATVAPAAAGFIAIAFGWRSVYLFYTFVVLAALAIVVIFVKKKELGREEDEEPGGKRKNNIAVTLAVLFMVAFLATFSTAGFKSNVVPLYSKDVLKLDTATISLVLSLMALMHLITSPIAAWYSDKYGRRVFLLLGLLATMLGSFAFLFVDSMAMLVIAAVLLGAGTMIFISPVTILGDITPRAHAGRNYGILRFVIDLGFVLGPVILGYIIDTYGFSAAALVTGSLSLLVFILAYSIVKEPAKHAKINWKRILQIEED